MRPFTIPVSIIAMLLSAVSVDAQMPSQRPITTGRPVNAVSRPKSYSGMYQGRPGPALQQRKFDPVRDPSSNPYANRKSQRGHVDSYYYNYARPSIEARAKQTKRLEAGYTKLTGRQYGGPNIGGTQIKNSYHGRFYNSPK